MGDWIVGVDVVVVVEDAVNRSFNSPANRTMSFAFTIRASRSLRASDISVAVFCAELSAFCMIPSEHENFRLDIRIGSENGALTDTRQTRTSVCHLITCRSGSPAFPYAVSLPNITFVSMREK